MSHKVYFPEDGQGGHDPVGYDVTVLGIPDMDGMVEVEFADGDVESVPASDVFECDDVTCTDPTHA